jgi:DNA-binding NarL/FixJ family response regulator
MRVLIVEDHELFAEALGGVVQKLAPGATLVPTTSAEAALEALAREAPFDLILLDLGLPRLRGPSAFEAIGAVAGQTPIVVVSGSEPGVDVAALLKKGARGFLHKRSSTAELTSALRLVIDGGTYVPPSLVTAPRVHDVPLTPRQTEVLRLLAKGASNKDIADALGCAEATVRVHVSTVLRLLGVENRTQAATSPVARRLIDE